MNQQNPHNQVPPQTGQGMRWSAETDNLQKIAPRWSGEGKRKMKKYNYKDLDLYKASKDLVLSVYALLRKFPKEEQYALCDQLRRAAISIPSNIAEGMGRVSTKEQIHFLEIAYGSLREVDCQLDIAKDLAYISDDELSDVEKQIEKVAALIAGMRKQRSASLNAKH